jgi:glycine cleavage system H lipoate-binding protein
VPVFLGVAAINIYQYVRRRALGLATAEGVLWRDALYYAPGHTWMRRLGFGALRVGLDDLAGRRRAGSSAVELPRPGRIVRAGEVIGVITCGDKRGEIRTPVGGRITGVNSAVARDPSLIHADPYARGWLFSVAPADARYRAFPRGERARVWLEQESLRFARFLERDLGVAAADGGEVLSPAPALLTQEQWRALTHAFLGSMN